MTNKQSQDLREREAFFRAFEQPTKTQSDKESKYTNVKVKRLRDDAIIPTKAHETDAGFDMYAAEDVIIEPGDTVKVPLGIAFELPEGFEMQIRPRSGITSKTKLRVQFGTVDEGFIGEVKVTVDNVFGSLSEIIAREEHYFDVTGEYIYARDYFETWNDFILGAYLIRKGDRIAQGVIQRIPTIKLEEVSELSTSERGEGGFGSSGV